MTLHIFSKEHDFEEVKNIFESLGFEKKNEFGIRYVDRNFKITPNLYGNKFQVEGIGARDIYGNKQDSEYFERFKEIFWALEGNDLQSFCREPIIFD